MVDHVGYKLNITHTNITRRRTIEQCIKDCFDLQSIDCWSFNVHEITSGLFQCEFLSTDRFRESEHYIVDSEQTHYALDVSYYYVNQEII